MKTHPIELSDHAIVDANLELDFKTEVGAGIWRMKNNILHSNYEFTETVLDQKTVNSANYDAI